MHVISQLVQGHKKSVMSSHSIWLCLQQERDISGDQSLSGNMVSSDCWGMSTVLILCKPVWGMICSAAQHPFLMENSPSSQSIYGSWKGHVEQDSVMRPCAARPQRWQDLNEVIWMISGVLRSCVNNSSYFFFFLYIRGMLWWNIRSNFLLSPLQTSLWVVLCFKSKMFYITPYFCSSDFQRWTMCFLV